LINISKVTVSMKHVSLNMHVVDIPYTRPDRCNKNGALVETFALIYVAFTFLIGFAISRRFFTKEMAIGHSYMIIEFEINYGFFIERDLQRFILSNVNDTIILAFNNFYLYAHIPCSVLFLMWMYRYHSTHYALFRNSFLLSHTMCILIQFAFPCAPPRMITDLGFVDTMMIYSKSDLMAIEEATGVNPYAAMPSMHFNYAFLVGVWGSFVMKESRWKYFFISYTVLVTLGIIITGNHFILDCIVSFITIVIGYSIISRWKSLKGFVIDELWRNQTGTNLLVLIVIILGALSTIVHIVNRIVL
jgi:hypothetical protein